MSKTYILRKNIEAPTGSVLAGTESVFDGAFYCFPYIGKYNDDKNGWLGNAFMCTEPEAWPEWFVLKPDSNIGKQIDIQNAISTLHHEGYKIISPENKSNDSFQWTDELVKKYAETGLGDTIQDMNYFKQLHSPTIELAHKAWLKFRKHIVDTTPPKPQADNKDWQILRWKTKDGGYYTDWMSAYGVKDLTIESVKRLGDGITFSVGEITDGGNKIKAFELIGDHLQVHMGTVETIKEGWLTNIQSLVKKKQPQPDWEIVEWAEKYIADNKPQPQKEEPRLTVRDISPSGETIATYDLKTGEKIKKEEQRIEVTEPWRRSSGISTLDDTPYGTYCFNSATEIPKEKLTAIKQAIEQVLNGDGDISKVYTSREADAMCEDAFNAAREKRTKTKYPVGENFWREKDFIDKYESFQDYKKSKQ